MIVMLQNQMNMKFSELPEIKNILTSLDEQKKEIESSFFLKIFPFTKYKKDKLSEINFLRKIVKIADETLPSKKMYK